MGEEGARGALLSLLGWLELLQRLGSGSGRSGVCCSLLAREGTIRWRGCRDSGILVRRSWAVTHTTQELVMERSPKSDPAPGRGEDAWLFLPLGEKAAAGRRGDSKECLVGFF